MKVSKINAEHYSWGSACDGWHLVNSKDLSVIHERMPPHTAEVRHLHKKAKQFFFVLKGQAAMELDGEAFILEAHEGIEVPPGVQHQMKNDSETDTEFIVVSAPSTKGDRVVETPVQP